ncbi:MAG TPA: hypothetical protein VF598_10695 [Hymenobacter sp.]|jgi:hypothetical protein
MSTPVDLSNLFAVTKPISWAETARKALYAKAERDKKQAALDTQLATLSSLKSLNEGHFSLLERVRDLTNAISDDKKEIKRLLFNFFDLIPASVVEIMGRQDTRIRLMDQVGAMDVFYDVKTLNFDVEVVPQSY